MSGHVRTARFAATVDGGLSVSELRDLFNVAVQLCGRPDSSPADLPEVVRLALRRLGRPAL